MILGYILHLIKIMPISDGMIEAIGPLGIGLIAGGAQALIGGIGSIGAREKVNRLQREEPKYEIPKEVFEATRRAEEMAQTGMPEASRMMALQNAQQSAVQAGRRAEMAGRGALLGNISNIQAGLDRANLSVAAQDASMRIQNQIRAQQALMTQAQFKDKAFANQWQSWMNRFQQERANLGAKQLTMYRGFDTMGSIAAMAAMGGLGGAGKTASFGGTDLTTATSGVSGQRNNISGMSAIMGTGIRPTMPGMQRPTPNYIPTANMPFYGEAMQDLFSNP